MLAEREASPALVTAALHDIGLVNADDRAAPAPRGCKHEEIGADALGRGSMAVTLRSGTSRRRCLTATDAAYRNLSPGSPSASNWGGPYRRAAWCGAEEHGRGDPPAPLGQAAKYPALRCGSRPFSARTSLGAWNGGSVAIVVTFRQNGRNGGRHCPQRQPKP
jgi:hypothetical protein